MIEDIILDTYDIKQFFKNAKDTKFELELKLAFTYALSRMEILNICWSDIDFDKKTITISPVSFTPNEHSCKNYWDAEKIESMARTYPLLPHIEELLLKRKKELEKIKPTIDFISLDKKGKRMNANTLSRNLKYILEESELPEMLFCEFSKSSNEFILQNARSYDYHRCWIRYDILHKKENIYKDYNLTKNNYFLKAFNKLIKQGYSFHDMEM